VGEEFYSPPGRGVGEADGVVRRFFLAGEKRKKAQISNTLRLR